MIYYRSLSDGKRFINLVKIVVNKAIIPVFVQAVELCDAARHELRASTGLLSGASTPAAWVAAFNESLAATEQLATAAAASPAATWRWPPPECGGREGTLPADWHDPAVQASICQALRNLRLPVFPRLGAHEGAHLALLLHDSCQECS